MSRQASSRIAILGAGPVGLEAALYAASLNLSFRVYERGQVGENLRRWGHVRMFTPFGMNSTPLGRATLKSASSARDLPAEGDLLTGREHTTAYLQPLAESSLLTGKIEPGVTVVAIARRGFYKEEAPGDARRGQQPFRLLLRDAAGKERVEEADIVLDCSGVYSNARYLGDGGMPALGELAVRQHIAWGLEDITGEKRTEYADKNVLVVGAGHSAATTISLLATLAGKHPGTWTVWLARGTGSQPIRRVMNDPLRERDLLAARANMLATRGEGNVDFQPGAVVESIERQDGVFRVRALVGNVSKSWTVDRVIANVGYEPDNQLYRQLQVHECYASLGPMNLAAALLRHSGADCLTVPAQGAATLRNPEPNFYILGNKSYGRRSNFLLRTGFDQVREVFTLIAGKPDLDLYRKKT